MVLSWFKKVDPVVTWFDILYLQINTCNAELERATVILSAMSVYFLWRVRGRGGVSPNALKAKIGATTSALLSLKYENCGKILVGLL